MVSHGAVWWDGIGFGVGGDGSFEGSVDDGEKDVESKGANAARVSGHDTTHC